MSAESLMALAMDYIKFMSNIGENPSYKILSSDLTSLFSDDVMKIENGKLIVIGYEELANQLTNAQRFGSPWSIEILDILSDEKNHSAIVRFTWNSKIVGLHITTAILKINQDNKIREIAEVYNKHGDITH